MFISSNQDEIGYYEIWETEKPEDPTEYRMERTARDALWVQTKFGIRIYPLYEQNGCRSLNLGFAFAWFFFFLFHLGKAARKAAAALSRSFGP